jgi:hypothetical protein
MIALIAILSRATWPEARHTGLVWPFRTTRCSMISRATWLEARHTCLVWRCAIMIRRRTVRGKAYNPAPRPAHFQSDLIRPQSNNSSLSNTLIPCIQQTVQRSTTASCSSRCTSTRPLTGFKVWGQLTPTIVFRHLLISAFVPLQANGTLFSKPLEPTQT